MGSIINISKIEDLEQLILVIFATVFIWLFKEFRKSYIDNKKANKIDIECALERYSNLYHTIVLFQSNNIDLKQLFYGFDQSIVYLSRKVAEKIFKLNKDDLKVNSSELDDLKTIIENEIISLKYSQYSFSSRNSDEGIYSQGSWFFTRFDFDALINPFIYAIFTFLAMSYMYLIAIKISELDGYGQFISVLLVVNVLYALMSLAYTLDLLIKRNLRKHALLLYMFLVIVPLFASIIISPQLSILNTITIMIFFIISFKKGLVKTTKK